MLFRSKAIFIDTPLDVALTRRVLRDMADTSGLGIVSEICEDCFCTDAKRCIAIIGLCVGWNARSG